MGCFKGTPKGTSPPILGGPTLKDEPMPSHGVSALSDAAQGPEPAKGSKGAWLARQWKPIPRLR